MKPKPTKRPALPKGYRWLKHGMRKPSGYMFWFGRRKWMKGNDVGGRITIIGERFNGPYIAPIRRKRK